MARIGFVGLGHMGLPMAINLQKAGHSVSGFDLQSSAREELAKFQGKSLDTLQAAAEHQDVFITMLQTGDQVAKVCLGDEGLYAMAAQGALHIDCSSIDVETTRKLDGEATKLGLLKVDAPVSGGVAGAKAGLLTFMVGGENQAFNKASPILAAMGENIYHTGIAGTGQAAKICNNMILGISMIAISEAFLLAEKLGLSKEKLFEVVNHASGQCWAMSKYPPLPGLLPDVPANHHYQPGFTTAMMLKDLNLSQEAAEKNEASTPLGAKAREIYQKFAEAGFGDLDFSAIIKNL